MLDDVLLSFSAAQFVIAGESNGGVKHTTMNATFAAVDIGESRYIYAITAFNIVLLLLFTVEALRNRGWRAQPIFDYRDPIVVIIGASLGGEDVALNMFRRKSEMGKSWNAEPGDRVAGRTRVNLGGENNFRITLSLGGTAGIVP